MTEEEYKSYFFKPLRDELSRRDGKFNAIRNMANMHHDTLQAILKGNGSMDSFVTTITNMGSNKVMDADDFLKFLHNWGIHILNIDMAVRNQWNESRKRKPRKKKNK